METAIVAFVVATAAAWLIRDYVRTYKSGKGSCGCGCSSCGENPDSCGQIFKEPPAND